MTKAQVFTFQAKIPDHPALAACGELFGRVERTLFADIQAGQDPVDVKAAYLKRFGIPARMFNAASVSVRGKTDAARESQRLRVAGLGSRIARAGKVLGKVRDPGVRHQKKRRLGMLKSKLISVQRDQQEGRVRVAFGSRKLWRKQSNLKANGYASHQEWLEDWRRVRSGEFFVLGSKDETAGCQVCVGTLQEDGNISLRLRIPDALMTEFGKYVEISGLRFGYGHERILAALAENLEYAAKRRAEGEKAARASGLGRAISYRFKRDCRGWRVFVSLRVPGALIVTDLKRGAIGVDVNEDHLAVSETDSSGNWLRSWRVPLVTYGKSSHQSLALIGDAVKKLVSEAGRARKPLVIERLDFRAKKALLEAESPKRSRMLSSFAHSRIKAFILSRSLRSGVQVFQVNPAYSSIIGRVKFQERYGLTDHQAAALVLARRLSGHSESLPGSLVVRDSRGIRLTFQAPARKPGEHVRSLWAQVSRWLGAVHAGQRRRGAVFRGRPPIRVPV